MFERTQKIFDRVESRIALWQIIAGGGVMGVGGVSAWVASATKWLDSYAPASWWFAGLLGALITITLALTAAWLRNAWIKGTAYREWGKQADTINPLDPDFQRIRIKVSDLAHPLTKTTKGKRFIDCQLVGPANILIGGKSRVSGMRFSGCDLVVINNKVNVPINNVVGFVDVEFIGGEFINCTIYIPPEMFPMFQSLGAKAITLTGDQAIDNPQPQDTEQETQQ